MQVLENDRLRVEIADHGAELSRVYDKVNAKECLHDADPKFWNRHSPVLFPFVGASYGGTYKYNGTEYKMGQHGFARDMDFKFVSNDGTSVVYELTDTEDTFAKYPFHFKLTITQTLKDNTVTVAWKVENTDTKDMLFNIGAHPAFLMGEGANYSDMSIDFGQKELTYYRIEDPGSGCCYTDKSYKLATDNGILHLTDDFFKEGVYIFEKGTVDHAVLYKSGKPVIELSAPGFPYFGLWSKPTGAPFICLEPWHGRCEAYGYDGELKDKEGVITLAPSGVFEASYEIKVC